MLLCAAASYKALCHKKNSTNTGHPIAVYTFEGRCKANINIKSLQLICYALKL